MYHRVVKLWLLCFIGFISYGQGKFQNFPKADSVDCNSSDFVSKASTWYNTAGGGTIGGASADFTIIADKNFNSFLGELGRLQDRLCEKERKVSLVFSIINPAGIRTDSIRTYFKINDDGIRSIRNPELNRRDTCFEGVEQRLIVWLKNGGNGQVGTFCSGPAGWTDFIFNGSDGSSGSGRVNTGPYPRIPSNACGWTLNVTFFAQDSCGNRRGFPGRYLIIDNQPPVLDQLINDLTVSCHQIPDTSIRVKDACDRQPTVSFKSTSTKGTNPELCDFYNYTINRQWVVADRCNNRDTFYQRVNITDNQPPVITLKNDVTVSCADTADINKLITGVNDNCSNYKLAYKDSIVRTPCVDLIYRSYSAEDVCNNQSSVTQKIFIQKSRPPVIIRNADVIPLNCGQNHENNYKDWLKTKGGLNIEAGCSQIRYGYGLKSFFDFSDRTTWKDDPPLLSQVLEEKSDTAFYIVVYTDCGQAVAVPVIKVRERKLTLITESSELCSNDTLKLKVNGLIPGDTVIWFERTVGIENQIVSSGFGELSYKITEPSSKIFVRINGSGCSNLYVDSLSVSGLIKKVSINRLNDISLCEGENLVLAYIDTTTYNTFTWITPDGTLLNGKKVNVTDKVNENFAGTYKYFGRSGFCNSDTLSFLLNVNKKPVLSIEKKLYETCGDSKVTLAIKATEFDSILWYKEKELIKKSVFDTLMLSPGPQSEGNYYVFAKKSDCVSDSTDKIVVKQNKTLSPDFEIDITKCEGDTTIMTAFGNYENIYWVLPSKDTLRVLSPRVKAVSGQYKMIVNSSEGCQGEIAKNFSFKTKPFISALTSDYSKCDSLPFITITPTLNKIDTSFRYTWTSPDNSILKNDKLLIPKDRFIFGNYTLVVSNGNCVSDTSKITVVKDSTLKKLDLKAPVFYCDLDTVVLTTEPGYDSYRFLLNGNIVSENSKFVLKFVPGRTDTLRIQVEAYNKRCLEGQSNVITILPGVKPSKPVISNGVFNICLADTLRLNVSNPDPDFDYIWFLPTGAQRQGKALRIIDLPGNLEGNYKVRAIRGTCISQLSDSVQITVKPKIDVPDFAQVLPPVCDSGNAGIKLCLTNIPKDTSIRYQIRQLPSQKIWYQGRDSCIERPASSFESATTRLRMLAIKGECVSDEFKETNVSITTQPDIKANIISDGLAICQGTDSIRLFNEKPIDTLQVIWRVFSNATLKTLPKNEISLSNLSRGVNRVILTISYLNCRNYSVDTLDLVVGLQPKAKDTLITSDEIADVLIPLSNYDSIGTYYFVEFDKTSKGEIVKKNGKYFLRPGRFFSGLDTITYTVCFGKCQNECKKAKVIVNFTKEISCDLPNIITPNGDGINDAFIVSCLGRKEWGSVDFLLFDQWGNEVYRSQDYKNDFEGKSGEKILEADTYYYIVKPSKSQERITGFLIIKY